MVRIFCVCVAIGANFNVFGDFAGFIVFEFKIFCVAIDANFNVFGDSAGFNGSVRLDEIRLDKIYIDTMYEPSCALKL
jgi:hypothetical protein